MQHTVNNVPTWTYTAPSTASFRLEDDVTLFASSSAVWPVERCVATIILQTSTQQMSECKRMHRR